MKFINYLTGNRIIVLVSSMYVFLCATVTICTNLFSLIVYALYSLILIITYCIAYFKYKKLRNG